jgi:hypothetical protein
MGNTVAFSLKFAAKHGFVNSFTTGKSDPGFNVALGDKNGDSFMVHALWLVGGLQLLVKLF